MVTLHTLLLEKQVSRAALRLHKSQPAVSYSLAHLRRIFEDPLLVRQSAKLELTSRAAKLLSALTNALKQLGALLEPPTFDPASMHRLFRWRCRITELESYYPNCPPSLRTMAPGIKRIFEPPLAIAPFNFKLV